MFAQQRSTLGLRALLVLAAATACGDRVQPTNPLTAGDPDRITAASPNTSKVKVKTLQLSSNTISLEGPAVAGNVDIGNSGAPIDGVSIRGEIVQGSVSKDAMLTQLNCAGNPGTLPAGTCSMTFSAAASNMATGTPGSLVAGSATFVLDVIQTLGTSVTVLATKSVTVTLVAPVAITNVTLNSTTVQIDGPRVGWTAVINNPSGALHGVFMQGTIVQGATRHAAGGAQISCGGSLGVLPNGLCTFAFTLAASNPTSESGTLIPGPATFQVQLLDSDGTTTTVLDTKNVAITLVANHPTITNVVVFPQELAIDGPTALVTVSLNNPTDAPVTGLSLAESVIQGDARRSAGGALVSCGAGDGVLPPGDCKMTLTAAAWNSATGSGTLMVGAAELSVDLTASFRTGPQVFDSRRTPITLLAAPTPIITDAVLSSQTLVLDGAATSYTVSLKNQNINSFTDMSVQVSLIQGGVVRASIAPPLDCGAGPNVLPQGSCIARGGLAVTSAQSVTLGDATIQIDLIQSSGTTITYDTRTIAVTVVNP